MRAWAASLIVVAGCGAGQPPAPAAPGREGRGREFIAVLYEHGHCPEGQLQAYVAIRGGDAVAACWRIAGGRVEVIRQDGTVASYDGSRFRIAGEIRP